MRRLPSTPRPGWRDTTAAQGLTFPDSPHEDGTLTPYWYEEAYYELTSDEVDHLETATEQLHQMSVEAARHMASGAMGSLGMSDAALELIRDDLQKNPPSLYGRLDLRFDGTGPCKLIEYNGDTPTGLIESSVIQWHWAQDVHPEKDQWNSIHERLVARWQELTPRLRLAPVHFAYLDLSDVHEEWMTTTYLRDTAMQAGLVTAEIPMTDIGFDVSQGMFVDLENQPIRNCFKLYPWEDMLNEPFGAHILNDPRSVIWIEPAWKALLSNKALLAALWQIYPDHELLLPAYLDDPGPLTEWVSKPLHGREGDGITINAADVQVTNPGRYGAEGRCFQQWCPLPRFDGNWAVLGSWLVGGKAAGLGIRESNGPITDFYARFVPHIIDAPTPTDAQRQQWLSE